MNEEIRNNAELHDEELEQVAGGRGMAMEVMDDRIKYCPRCGSVLMRMLAPKSGSYFTHNCSGCQTKFTIK